MARARLVVASILQVRTVVGDGDSAVVVEPRGHAVRIKIRGHPEVFVRYDVLPELARTLGSLAGNLAKTRG